MTLIAEHTPITATAKGHRVWLQGTGRYGWPVGTRYNLSYDGDSIVLERDAEGKRKVSKGKGGIIDLTSKKVSQWAGDSEVANVFTNGSDVIIFEKVWS